MLLTGNYSWSLWHKTIGWQLVADLPPQLVLGPLSTGEGQHMFQVPCAVYNLHDKAKGQPLRVFTLKLSNLFSRSQGLYTCDITCTM